MADPLEALAEALVSEEAWQRAEHARLLGLPLAERVANGLTWAPLELEDVREASRGRTLVRLRTPRGQVLHDGIEGGDAIHLGPLSAPDDGADGLCLGSDERVVEVLVEDPPLAGPLAVTRRFDARTFARYRKALEVAAARSSPLREVLLGRREPGGRPPELPDSPHFESLEAHQRHAARLALATPEVGLVHGPPGTGKTRLLVALLQALVDRGERPWALADSNAAVDHLALRADAAGLDVVRLGHPARIGSAASRLSLGERIAAGPLGEALDRMDRDLVKLRGQKEWKARRSLLAERDRLEAQARQALLARCEVMASTFGTLARVVGDLPGTVTAVVDEATQALEPAVWVTVPHVERLVLVGDPCQLGPVVTEPGNPLARSLLQRLLEETRLQMPMLRVQHRMHVDIQSLVAPVYEDALSAHPTVAGHRLVDLPGVAAHPLTEATVRWVDTVGSGFEEARDPVTASRYNEGEVALIDLAARALRRAGLPPEALGVIAPYSAQVARLSALASLEGVEVHTVNAFQGREKEAILCSFVRSNPEGDLGFVADERRLTVALSRARRFLLCVGDSQTLGGHPRFAAVIDRIQALGGLRSVWEVPWTEALS